jgi:hypothetical protein
MLPWNPIYPGIAALFVGALASGLCRPDLWRNMLVGGIVFLAVYAVFLSACKCEVYVVTRGELHR